ncbi:MAG: hypothetical protein MRZ79_17375, partial [Bacteroidia bacterium]|nr:hypothetical protein [Bacteroidia bacterium]
LEEALKYFELDLGITQELYDSYPQNVSFKNGLALSYANLGEYYKKSDKDKARKNYVQAKVLWEELTKDFPSYAQFRKFLNLVQERLEEFDL